MDWGAEIWNVIAPILLPLFSLLVALVDSPTPVLEWDVIERTDRACTVEMTLATTGETDLSKLSIVPSPSSPLRMVHSSPFRATNIGSKTTPTTGCGTTIPTCFRSPLRLEWDDFIDTPDTPLLDIAWEHIAQGKDSGGRSGHHRPPGMSPNEAPRT